MSSREIGTAMGSYCKSMHFIKLVACNGVSVRSLVFVRLHEIRRYGSVMIFYPYGISSVDQYIKEINQSEILLPFGNTVKTRNFLVIVAIITQSGI